MMGRTLIMIGIGDDGEAHVLGTSARNGSSPPETKFVDGGNEHRSVVACALIVAACAGGAEVSNVYRTMLGNIADEISGGTDGI